jgi:16S rRNA (cytidine1402-2'-O)-methyltransferase
MRPLHSHSSDSVINTVIKELLSGKNAAYLSDSGTPGVSDPGSKLINAARMNNITICPLPGASALTALASVAGFPEKQIVFSGFLSKKDGKRIRELESLKQSGGIIIIYESPYRIKKLLLAISKVFPGGKVLIGREMTKFFEEFISGTIEEIISNIDTLKEKGEFAVAVYMNTKKTGSSDDF